jgi:hypothetical protein
MTVGANATRARLIQGVLIGGQNVHRHALQRRIGLHRSAKVVAAAGPQHRVGDDQVRPRSLGGDHCLVHRPGGHEGIVLASQDHSEGLLDRQAVVGDQYALAHRIPKQSLFDNT